MEIIAASSHNTFANGKSFFRRIRTICLPCAMTALLCQCFQIFSDTHTDILVEAQSSTGIKLIETIRPLLVSNNTNDTYLFVSCLDNLDAKLWAGTTSEIRSGLDACEVERVMQLLDSPDPSLRKLVSYSVRIVTDWAMNPFQTLKVLKKVDVGIVEAYYTQLLQASATLPGVREQEEAAQRLFEVVTLLSTDSGETYAQHLKRIIGVVERAVSLPKPHVVQVAIEHVLATFDAGEHRALDLANNEVTFSVASIEFRAGFIGVLAVFLDDSLPDEKIGPTMVVVLCAIVSEYFDLLPVPPTRTLQGLARLLPSNSGMLFRHFFAQVFRGLIHR